MADRNAYRDRAWALFAQHDDFEDVSLLYVFPDFLLDFEGGYERPLSGETPPGGLGQFGIHSNIKMSSSGLEKLRDAARTEADHWTEDLRKKEQVMAEVCQNKASYDSVTLSRKLAQAEEAFFGSRLRRYQDLLASLDQNDRDAIDTLFLERARRGREFPRKPRNAEHIYDILATEFPDVVSEQVEDACERYRQNKGKRYIQFRELGKTESVKDSSGTVVLSIGTSTSGYKLAD